MLPALQWDIDCLRGFAACGVNAKKRSDVLLAYTFLLFFVPFVRGSAAWMFFCLDLIVHEVH